MSNIEKAVASFKKELNCAQAIISTYGPPLGLKRDMALKIAAAFGGGMGHLGRTCGAISGALMVIGLHCSKRDCPNDELKKRSNALAQEFLKKFQDRHVYTDCKELIGLDISTTETMRLAREKGVFDSLCTVFVRSAGEILEELLAED